MFGPNVTITALADAVHEAARYLERHGDVWVVQRLDRLKNRLDRGDLEGIATALSEATGGTGSLNDRILGLGEGAALDNACLRELVKDIERAARSAASAHGVRLVR